MPEQPLIFSPDLSQPVTPQPEVQTPVFPQQQAAQEAPQPVSESMSKYFSGYTPQKGENSPLPIYTPQQQVRRYDTFNPWIDNEEVAAQNQGIWSKWWNSGVKFGASAISAFANGMMSIPDGIKSIAGNSPYKTDMGFDLDQWQKNLEDTFPNYYTKWEREHPFQNAIPFWADLVGGGGSAVNFWGDQVLKNAGYTVGAIGSAVLQDYLLGTITGGTGLAPAVANQFGKASLWLNKLFSGTNKLDETLNALSAIRGSKNTLLTMENLAATAQGQKLATGARYITSLYGASNAEAGMEARQGYTELKNQLINEYTTKNGYAPTGEELTKIEQTATDAGNYRYGANMALLTLSNAIQFESILKPFSSFKNSLKKGVAGKLEDVGGIEAIKLAETEVKTAEAIDNIIANTPKNIWQKVGRTTGKLIPNILSEGVLEEGGQFAVEKATNQYFADKYNGKIKGTVDDAINASISGLAAQFGTTEGIQNMVLGGITGALFEPITQRIENVKRRKAGLYTENEATNAALNSLKSQGVTGIFQQNYDATADATKKKQDITEAVQENNIFKFKNLQRDSFFNFVTSGINAGRYDVRIEQLNLLKELPEQELNKLFGIEEGDRVSSHAYIDNLIAKANQIKSTHDSISGIFQNPFTYKGNDQSEEGVQNNQAYLAYEEYKSALTKFTYNVTDFNNRLASIQSQLAEIHPSLNNQKLAQLTNLNDLKKLSAVYKEQSEQLQESIKNKAALGDTKIEYQERIKKLDTLAAQIDRFANTPDFNEESFIKTFSDVANFEVNGRSVSNTNPISKDQSVNLIRLGHDVNQINKGIEYASSAFDYLFTQDGFDDFMKNYEEWRDSLFTEGQEEEQDKPEEGDVEVDSNIFKAGREYQPTKDLQYKVVKNGETFDLRNPFNETVDNYKSEEEANKQRDYENDNLKNNLSSVRVIKVNDNGTIQIEDNKGNYQNIDKRLLKNYKLIKSEAEKAQENAEVNAYVENELNKLANENSSVATIEVLPEDYYEFEKAKKPLSILFNSTTYSHKTSGEKDFIKHQQLFLTNLYDFKNVDKLKAVIVTKNNEDALGLTGLTDMLLEGTGIDKNDPKVTPISVVFIEKKGNSKQFVNVNGEKIGKVGQPVDIQQVIVGTLPTSSLTWSDGDTRYSQATAEEAKQASEQWDKHREDLLNAKDSKIYDFSVSRGMPIRNEENEQGFIARNTVGGTLINENDIDKAGIIKVATQPVLVHQGQQIKFPVGGVYFENGSTLELLNNRHLTNKESAVIYDVIKQFVKQANDKKSFNRQALNYLNGIIFWGTPKGEASNKQIWFEKGVMHFGKDLEVPFTVAAIENQKNDIISYLNGNFINVNNNKLRENGRFEEIIGINEDGSFETVLWKSYQEYLISPTYRLADKNDLNGKNRGEVPITTTIAKSTEDTPNFIHKYATVEDLVEGSQPSTPVNTAKAEEPVEDSVEGVLLDDGRKIVFTRKDNIITPLYILNNDNERVELKDKQKAKSVIERIIDENRVEEAPVVKEKYITDGTTENTYTTPSRITIKFKATKENNDLKLSFVSNDNMKQLIENFSKKADTIQSYRDAGATGTDEEVAKEAVLDILTKLITRDYFENTTTAPITTKEETKIEATADTPKPKPKGKSSRSGDYRTMLQDRFDYQVADMNKEEEWFKKRFNIPFNRLTNLILTTSGGYAFGEFKNAAVYIYENAEVGTTYHEAFETVWGMFTSLNERKALVKEFRNRQGEYTDRETGTTVKYSNATERQIKEQLAEEFRHQVITNEPAYKPSAKSNAIYKFFKDLINWIKSFFIDDVNSTQELFDRINAGYYKVAAPKQVYYNEGGNYRIIPGLSETDTYKIIRGVTIEVFQKIFGNGNQGIVDLDETEQTPESIYAEVHEELRKVYNGEYEDTYVENPTLRNLYLNLWNTIDSNWGLVKSLTDEYLKTFGIVRKVIEKANDIDPLVNQDGEFVDNDKENVVGENTDRSEAYLLDQFKHDFVKSAPTSIKMLIATLTEAQFESTEYGTSIKSKVDPTTYMQQMVEYSKTMNYLMDKLYKVNSWEEKSAILAELKETNPTYVRLFNRLKLNNQDEQTDIYDWILRARFNSLFSKQKPDGEIQYVSTDRVFTESANLNTAVAERVGVWMNQLKTANNGFITTPDGIYTFNGKEASAFKVSSVNEQISFLNAIGIDFTMEMYQLLPKGQKDKFSKTVVSLHGFIKSKNGINEITPRNLGATSDLKTLATLYVQTNGQGAESTYYNIEKERVQQYLQGNTIDYISKDINNSESLSELQNKHPHYKNLYFQDSVYLKEDGLLFDKNGKRKANPLNIKYIQGTLDINTGNVKLNSKLSEADRFMQQFNQNLNKKYYIMVPADSKTEWMLEMDHLYNFDDFSTNAIWDIVGNQFEQYWNTEKQVANGDKAYKGMLYPRFGVDEFNKDGFKDWVEKNVKSNIEWLKRNGVITIDPANNKFVIKEIDTDFANKYKLQSSLTDEEIEQLFTFQTINYMVNNVEMHKLFFGDINKIKDPTKRYKSFLSPRESSFVSDGYNNILDETYNKVGDIQLTYKDPGYWEHSNIMTTVTISDILTDTESITNDTHLSDDIKEPYSNNNVTDAQSWAQLAAYREICFKRGFTWTKGQQLQFEYLMALDRFNMDQDTRNGILPEGFGYKYTSKELRQHDESLIAKGNPASGVFNPLKPVGTGFTIDGNTFLDKTSVYPLTYSDFRTYDKDGNVQLRSNALLYVRMMNDYISYAIAESGRKIGNTGLNNIYNADGTVNIEPFTNQVYIPFQYYGIQVETGGEHDKNTLGSQLSKMATMNLLDAGMPSTFENRRQWEGLTEVEKRRISPIYDKVRHNMETLEELQRIGYQELIDKFGIEDTGYSYIIPDKTKVAKLLNRELLRREASSNKKSSIQLDPVTNEFIIPFEATDAYVEIKSILFSYVDKLIAKPKVNGGQRIQISSAGFEIAGKKVVKKQVKGKDVFTSTGLKFYEAQYDKDGNRVSVSRMQVMLPNWFANKLRKAGINKTNEELIEFLNSTKEGKEVLNGVGFRIPTQDTNSIEAFEVAAFLPSHYGDSVVVPDAITTKSGSDFDVDKLNTYLKNVYVTKDKQIKVVPYFGTGQQAKDKLADWILANDVLTKQVEADRDAIDNLDIDDFVEDEFTGDKLYRQSIENEYFRSIEELILTPENFERLVTPSSTKDLVANRDMLVKLAPEEFGVSDSFSVLNMRDMNKNRHLNLIGKGGVGIAASAQTNNALNQLSVIYIDTRKISQLSNWQRFYIGDGKIALPHNTVEVFRDNRYITVSTLSLTKDKADNYISTKLSEYVSGFVDIAKDPFISQVIQDPKLISTFLFLEKMGVPSKTVALFMNQPIIREYVNILNRSNSGLFNKDAIEYAGAMFGIYENSIADIKLTDKLLAANIKKYYSGKELTYDENATQQFVLDEFLKYAMMSNNLFDMQRGTSYDTTRTSDMNSALRKNYLTDVAEYRNIFNSVNDILKNSFLGTTRTLTENAANAIGESLFKTADPHVKLTVQSVIKDLFNMGLSAEDFNKYARNVEQSFIDYLVQTNTGLNNRISDLIMDAEKSLAQRISALKKDLPKDSDLYNNTVLQKLIPVVKRSNKDAKYVNLIFKVNDAFTSDVYSGALRELRDNPLTTKLYGDIIRLSFLQSGVGSGPYSYSKYIPFEDYAKAIQPTIDKLASLTNIDYFASNGAFFRNNWNDDKLVKKLVSEWKMNERTGEFYSKYKLSAKWFRELKDSKGIKSSWNVLYKVDSRSNSANSAYLKISTWIDEQDYLQYQIDPMNRDFAPTSILLKRLEDERGIPITQSYPKGNGEFLIYYPINAWGNGSVGVEYKDDLSKSDFNNGYLKVDEISNQEILDAWRVSQGIEKPELPTLEENKEKINLKKGNCK